MLLALPDLASAFNTFSLGAHASMGKSNLHTTVFKKKKKCNRLMPPMSIEGEDMKRFAPSADRNKDPISDALGRFPPWKDASSRVQCLEVASGTGQHVSFLAANYPHMTFWPTEYGGGSAGPEAPAHESLRDVFASIVSYSLDQVNVRKPIELDAAASEWPAQVEATRFAAVYACNVCHISPFVVTEGLFRGAARILSPGGGLFIYGPFKVDGKHTAPSNEEFDKRLRSRNSEWGVRNVNDLDLIGSENGLRLAERISMPSNNFLLYFVREAVGQPEAL